MTLVASPEATCEACGKAFQRFSSFQRVCRTPRCAGRIVKMDKKREADETRARRVAMKTRRDWMPEAQKAFNAYIRARDARLPCVSCGETNPPMTVGGQWDAGHFLSVGSHPELRFNPDNCHKQCKTCNAGSGKFAHKARTVAQAYRIGLIARIGLERVEALEGPHPPTKHSVDELKTIRDAYRLLTKQELEKQ